MTNRWTDGIGHYLLGLDLGTTSIGWAVIACDDQGRPERIANAGVRRFDAGVLGDIESGRDESRATERRAARGPRRQTWRRQWRLRKVFRLLARHGLLPQAEDAPEARHQALLELDAQLRREFLPEQDRIAHHLLPYHLRAAALDRPLPPLALGRALYHLAQRRGFLSNRKANRDDEEQGVVKQGIAALDTSMTETGARTLGEYFSRLDPEEERIRARWTSRRMYLDEFEKIWAEQSKHSPDLTDDLKQALHTAIFEQRPLKSQKGLIGRCDLEPEKRRALLACLPAQRFRLLQRVNDLIVTAPDGEIIRFGLLAPDEAGKNAPATFSPQVAQWRQLLLPALEQEGDLTWAAVKKLLGMKKSKEYGRHWEFNFETGGDKKMVGNRTAAKMLRLLGQHWAALSSADQDRMVDEILSFESEYALAERLQKSWKIPPEKALAVAEARLEAGFLSLSRKAISKLMPELEKGYALATAIRRIYPGRLRSSVVYDRLPPVRAHRHAGGEPSCPGAFTHLRNPAVERALSELRKVVNELLRRLGSKPLKITVELGRDLKHSRGQRQELTDRRDSNTRAREAAKAQILAKMGQQERSVTAENILKVRLAEECGWVCPYTGKSIGMKALVGDEPQFDIEHIIPFSRSLDNSFANKTLCYHEENRRKGNRTPWEAYHDTDKWDEIIGRVKRFNSDARSRKLALFLTEKPLDQTELASRQLNDTRYISRLAAQYLGMLYGDKVDTGGSLRVHVTKGGATAYLRQRWNLNSIIGHDDQKNRGNHRHHAIDAIVVALTNGRAVQKLAEAAEEAERRGIGKLFADVDPPWEDFLAEARTAVLGLNVSYRVNHKLAGSLHKDTNLSKPHVEREKKSGKSAKVHYVRKKLESMSANEVGAIVDPVIRKLVQERVTALGGNPQKAFADRNNHPHLSSRSGLVIPIHKARIRKSDKPMAIGDGSHRRYVNPGSNHHMAIIAELDEEGREKKWTGELVSRFEAATRKRAGEPIVRRERSLKRKFKFTLAGGDHVLLYDQGKDQPPRLVRVTTISDGQLEFVLHDDARPITDRKKIPGARIRLSPEAMRKAKAQKILVSPLGEISPAND